MHYILQAKADKLAMATYEDHKALSYKVLVTPFREQSWAEVLCSCGKVSRTDWTKDTGSYRGLVFVTWFEGCGRDAYVTLDADDGAFLPR